MGEPAPCAVAPLTCPSIAAGGFRLMENLAHTLFGLALAKAGLERTTPLATTALVISSNLPDADVIVRVRGITSYLEHHRGLTHSLVGLVVLALALSFLLF
jgi:inner membrane protein